MNNKHIQQFVNPNRCDSIIVKVFVIFVLLLIISPFFIWGKDCYITIHDNLDLFPPFMKASSQNGFFSVDGPSNLVDNTSTVYFGWGGWSIMNLLYFLFPAFVAYVIMYLMSVTIGFISMLKLQQIIFGNQNNSILYVTSLIYAILPIIPCWSISLAVLPFSCLVFYRVYKRSSLGWLFASFFIPFLMEFNCCALFVLALWGIVFLLISIKERSIHKYLLGGFFLFMVGLILFHFKLFYMQFVLGEDLNRNHYMVPAKGLLDSFLTYFIYGFYHATIFVKYIVFPSSLLLIIFIFIRYVNGNVGEGLMTKDVKVLFFCFFGSCFFAIIAAMDSAKMLDFIKDFIPPLKGFSLTRVYVFNRLLWYLGFSAVLIFFSKYKFSKYLLPFILVLQVLYVLSSNCYYNDTRKTIVNYAKASPNDEDLTWNEFYDEDLFERIKHDVSYKGEPVVEVGYHSMILMYNGFNTVGGYLAYYPYKDMLKFERLLAPEFKTNLVDRDYFKSWGGRRYIYNSDLPFKPTRTMTSDSVPLRIDFDVFKNEYGGKYIISRAPLKIEKDIDVEDLGKWDSEGGVYTMYVYRVN